MLRKCLKRPLTVHLQYPINYEEIEQQKTCENFGEIEQLYKEILLKNVGNIKRYYDHISVGRIDRRETEKIKQLLNEEYLLNNDEDNDEVNDEKCSIKLDFKDIEKGAIYGNNEKTIKQLDEEYLFNIITKRLINIIIIKMKNEGYGNAFYKLINEENISETFVSQFLKCVMDSVPILLENKNKCYAMQTRSQLKNSRNISMDKNEDNIKNKLIRKVEITFQVQKKHGRPRQIIQEMQLQEPIKKRDRPRKVINKSPQNDKKRKFMKSEDESDSNPDYDVNPSSDTQFQPDLFRFQSLIEYISNSAATSAPRQLPEILLAFDL